MSLPCGNKSVDCKANRRTGFYIKLSFEITVVITRKFFLLLLSGLSLESGVFYYWALWFTKQMSLIEAVALMK